MKSREHIVTNGKAAFYACIWPDLRQAALDCGWALGLHGSLASDMDIMAMPWTEDAKPVEEMIKALSGCFTGSPYAEHHLVPHTDKPNGRVVYTMSIWADFHLDINIIQPLAPPPESKGLDLEAVLRIGGMMANAFYNICQRPEAAGDYFSRPDVQELQRKWDEAVRRLRAGAEGSKAFISPDLFASLREAQKENEGWTFYLPDPLGPPGQPRSWDCNYCYQPKAEHRDDGRCPIKGCTLAGPPAGAEGGGQL